MTKTITVLTVSDEDENGTVFHTEDAVCLLTNLLLAELKIRKPELSSRH